MYPEVYRNHRIIDLKVVSIIYILVKSRKGKCIDKRGGKWMENVLIIKKYNINLRWK